MARTLDELVGGIIELNEDIDLEPFITAASSLVDLIDEYANADTETLNEDRLELIERWLSAHFYCMRDPRTVSERAGPVSATYQSKIGFNLALSHYGQMAMILDTSGYLTLLSNGDVAVKRLGVFWLGTEDE